jgi:hypothetical protein
MLYFLIALQREEQSSPLSSTSREGRERGCGRVESCVDKLRSARVVIWWKVEVGSKGKCVESGYEVIE